MTAYRRKTSTLEVVGADLSRPWDIVQQAVSVLQEHHARKIEVQRWVCELCGMIHTGSLPEVCDSCGQGTALVQQPDFYSEIGSRW